MALLAAVALAVTVLVAQRALSHASEVVMRGEADGLVSTIVTDITQAEQDGTSTTKEWLAHELELHADRGLRYVAIVQRDSILAEAGTPTMPDVKLRPGETSTVEKRVRVTGFIPPIHAPQGLGGPYGPRPHLPPALLVVELEPPMIEQLRGHLQRISFVAAGAAAVLVLFAIALSRSAARLAAIEQRAAREQRLVALGGMSSVMAHELRNPLASLKGHAQLLAEDLDEELDGGKPKKKAERVVAEAQRIEELTTSLLDFVRDGPIEAAECTPTALVERALADVPRERVDVTTEEMPPFVVDESRLARAVHNLVDNALKASKEAEHVELTIARGNSRERVGEVVITVRDHGPGITDEKMFEPFVTTRVRGTGLGLPVARRIAEQHDGTLVGENHASGGAVFTLRFPARSAGGARP